MADILDSAGLHIDDVNTRYANIISAIRARISPVFDDNVESPQGQLIWILCEHMQQLAELAQAVYASATPSGANGASLDNVCAITGTYRSPGTKSTVTAKVNVDPGTYLAGSLIASVSGSPDYRFASAEDVINSGGGAANYYIQFESENYGPIPALTGKLTVIADPVTGWNSITNEEDAIIGADEETDTQLRLRRYNELVTGSTNISAIRTSLLQVAGVEWASVQENDTDAIVGDYPPHSISPVIHGDTATDLDIAQAIFTSKPCGITTYGTDNASAYDSEGNSHTMYFSRASKINVWVSVALDVNDLEYDGDSAVKSAIVDYANDTFGVGDDISPAKLIHAIFDGVNGVNDITEILLGTSSPPSSPVTLPIEWNEIGIFSTSRITVTS